MTFPLSFRAAGLTAALAGLCAAQETAAPSASVFARALPADTIFYTSIPDIPASMAEMRDMPLAKMWREEEVQNFFGRALEMAEGYMDEGMGEARKAFENGMFPFDPDELLKARISSMSMAVTALGMDMPEGSSQPLPNIGFVAHADFGASAPIWRNVLQTGISMMQAQAGEQMVANFSEVGQVELMNFNSPGNPTGMSLNIAFIGNGVLVGSRQADVTGMLQRLQGEGGGDGLVAGADFQAAASQVQFAGAEAEYFMRPGAFIDFAMNALTIARDNQPGFPPIDIAGIERAVTALGLRSIDSISSTSRYAGDRCITESFVSSPASARRGLLGGTDGNLDLSMLRYVPKDASSFSAMRLDVPNIWNSITGALRAYDENLAEMAMGQLSAMEEQFGMSLENDLFGAFGDHMIYWSMPSAAMMGAPEMGILLSVTDEQKILKTLQTVANNSQGMLSLKKTRRGTWQLRVEADIGGGLGGVNPLDMLVPHFTFKDGYMVMAFTTSDVKRALARMDREDDADDDIRSNPAFSGFAGQIPTDGISSLSFTDWRSSFESAYSLVAMGMMMVPFDESVPIEPELLPMGSTLSQHLTGGVSWSRTSPEGFRSVSSSPFGPEMVMLLVGGIAAGAATFAVMSGDSLPFGR